MEKLFQNYGKSIAAVEEDGKSISYAQLYYEASRVYEHMNKRCMVFSLCTNSIGSLIGYVSFQEFSVVPLLLQAKLDTQLYQYLLETYQPEYIWSPVDNVEKIKDSIKVYESFDYGLYRTKYAGPVIYSELALLLTTSGSTGSPKLVRQSYNNLLANTKAIVEYLGITDKERPITTLPMNYTYGLSIINTHLHVGAEILLTDRGVIEKQFWNFFKDYEATSIAGVPYTYEMLNRLRFFNMNLPSLRTMTQAGGKLLPALHKRFAEYALENNKKFIVMYGQTEATARMAYLPSEKSLEKYGSMGIAIPGGKFELWDLNKKVINQANVAGELVYSGDNVTLGYAESADDLCKGDERGGILPTGDVAECDADGFYFIVGRLKRFLKIFGNRVNLDEVERLIKTEFQITDCACTGVDDQMEIYVANISESKKTAIKRYISEKTGLNSSAFTVECIGSIPKNDSGKILYSKLEEMKCKN